MKNFLEKTYKKHKLTFWIVVTLLILSMPFSEDSLAYILENRKGWKVSV